MALDMAGHGYTDKLYVTYALNVLADHVPGRRGPGTRAAPGGCCRPSPTSRLRDRVLRDQRVHADRELVVGLQALLRAPPDQVTWPRGHHGVATAHRNVRFGSQNWDCHGVDAKRITGCIAGSSRATAHGGRCLRSAKPARPVDSTC